MERVKTIFFDLDNTLFDHNKAERVAHEILYERHRLLLPGVDFREWLAVYAEENVRLWKQMSDGAVTPSDLRVLRFSNTLLRLGCSTSSAPYLAREYVEIYSSQNFSCPNVRPTLEHLQARYELGVLSNGFADIQRDKLDHLDLSGFFRHVVYSDAVGAMKPHLEIFQEALKIARREPAEVAYIGDSYSDDVVGAKRAGWYAIHYNPSGRHTDLAEADAVVSDLLDLVDLF